MTSLALLFALLFAGPQTAQAPITFDRDIAPIVFRRCAGCHHPGGGAPFSLLTFNDVRRRATLIERLTASRAMPPWKAESVEREFVNERRLSDAEISLIREWVEKGTPEGDAVDLPSTPRFADGWQLGRPDLVVTMPVPYRLASGGSDVFRTFVVPIPITGKRYVKGFEFRAGSLSVVHHAEIKIDRTRASRRLDEEDPEPGYDGGGPRTAVFPDGLFLSWTPGQQPRMLPEGMGWLLEPGSDLVLELHLMPSGKPESVQASVALFFSDQPPSQLSFILRLGSQTIDIPAGESHYVVTDTFVLPVDVQVFSLQPHAHNLARQMEAFARLPDGTTIRLLTIRDWDFRWQDVYRYRIPLPLPRSTTLVMRYVYDNSAGNLRNPNQPPRRVTFGQTTASEMGNLWLQLVPRNDGDLRTLELAYTPKMISQDIAGYEKSIEVSPADARLRTDLALRYLDVGRPDEALIQLQEAAHLAPASASSHYAFGTVLLDRGRLAEAQQQLLEAVRLEPGFSEAHNNLGIISQAHGQLRQAIAHYDEAVRLDPNNHEALYNIGRLRAGEGELPAAIDAFRRDLRLRPDDAEVLSSLASALASSGQTDEAVANYRRALTLQPDLPAALTDLAWILATSERAPIEVRREAVRLAQRAAAATSYQNATVLETLALAYLAEGSIIEAYGVASVAISLASQAGAEDLRRDIGRRFPVMRLMQWFSGN